MVYITHKRRPCLELEDFLSLSFHLSSSAKAGNGTNHNRLGLRRNSARDATMTKAIVDGSSITKKIPVREPSAFDSISTVVPADILNDRNSTTPTRTIFKRYWDVTEEEKIVLSVAGGAYAPLPSLSSFSSVSSVEEGTESYSDENGMNGRDSILAESGPQSPAHPANEPPPKLVVQRRSIFQPIEEFVPSLGLRHTGRASSSRPQLRKAQSTSVLMTKQRSCLRPVRSYSSGEEPGSLAGYRPRVLSVSFSPEVDVFEFQKPREIHAHDGWTKLFI
mmetsp:Transcript_33336/g.68032  ORF Transcript_33336/g.68032 Transcript_33336/m.68032 type:complete len:277 (-) Transcript_33336:58-888(-)